MPAALSAPIVLGPITIAFLVDADDSNGSITLFRCDVKDGAGMPVPHSHDAFEETAYGLAGITTLTLDGEQMELGPGETVCIRRGQVHSFMANAGDASFLSAATPGVFGPAYFREVAEILQAAGDGPPDHAALAATMRRHGLTPAPLTPA